MEFIEWLKLYGEKSQDWQDVYANNIGNNVKSLYYKNKLLGTFAVAPLVFLDTFFPSSRKYFAEKQRFPIADAHYSMGFSYLFKATGKEEFYSKGIHFLNELKKNRCSEYTNYCWGYPFNWSTVNGTIKKDTPLITTTPYAYEAFYEMYCIDKDQKWIDICSSIAKHAYFDIHDFEISENIYSSAYGPHDCTGKVINASAYRSYLLTHAYDLFGENNYWYRAQKNINFVLETQNNDGSWFYAADGKRFFIDHFHTCFVLKNLTKIEKILKKKEKEKEILNKIRNAISRGIDYYISSLFDEDGLPKPFSKKPRMILYKKELYDYAESINLCILLRNRYEKLNYFLNNIIKDLNKRWKKPDGSYRSRKLIFGWDNIPMHRWAQSQLFRSLCYEF